MTHYQRLLNYIVPDYVHVMEGGRIIKTGGKELALELENRGYDWVVDEFQAGAKSVATAEAHDHRRPSLHRLAAHRHARAAEPAHAWLNARRGAALERANALAFRRRATKSGASPI